jgi:copper transport protein
MRAMRLALALCLMLLAPVGGALAHAQFLGADPPEGAALPTPPGPVALRFNEAVAPLSVRWFLPDGAEAQASVAAQGATLLVTPPAELPEGTHLLSWRVVSEDGHPVGGSLSFGVGGPAGAPPAVAEGAGAALPAVLARFALTAALALGVGGAVFARLIDREGAAPPGARRLARGAAFATPPLALLMVGAAGLDRLGEDPAALAGAAPWIAGLADPAAAAAGAAALAGALAAPALRDGAAMGLTLAAWGAAGLSFTLSGHAATAEPAALARGALALHGLALTLWLGALPGLLAAALAPSPRLGALLGGFSSWGSAAVATLAVTGATLTALQSGGLAALTASAYGAVLGAKLALVAAMVALAALNRWRLTPAIAAGAAPAARAFRRSAAAEIALGLGVLALAASFRLTPPPRGLAEAAAPPLAVHLHGPTAMADLTLRPGRVGANMAEIFPADADFRPMTPLEVTVAFSAPGRGVEPVRLKAERGPDGAWRAGPVVLPFAGDWEARVDLLVSDFEEARLGATLRLPE